MGTIIWSSFSTFRHIEYKDLGAVERKVGLQNRNPLHSWSGKMSKKQSLSEKRLGMTDHVGVRVWVPAFINKIVTAVSSLN